MEAVGLLAGGVAHDFNNLLTGIIGYTALLKKKVGTDDTAGFADQILKAAERATHLIRSLLAFSRKQIIDSRPIRLNEVIRRIESLLRRVIGEDIELCTLLSSSEATVLADAHQIEQVLMNLGTNARDAMPEGGVLTIATDLVEADEAYRRQHPYLSSGTFMRICVTDTGTGMDAATKEKIFEPFFTTKERGKGTGLGLSIIYGIVKQHNGFIDVQSEKGEGARFTIHFPVVNREEDRAHVPEQAVPVAGGTELVLVAEDDENVRALTENILKDQGYRVILASDGNAAVEKFHEQADRVDLAILDVLMPGKNGKEVSEEIRKRRADIRILFMSGYTEDLIHKKGILDTGIELLAKPFTPETLLRKVRQVLQGDARTTAS
jgi:DNA-binding response OmpR family regulator